MRLSRWITVLLFCIIAVLGILKYTNSSRETSALSIPSATLSPNPLGNALAALPAVPALGDPAILINPLDYEEAKPVLIHAPLGLPAGISLKDALKEADQRSYRFSGNSAGEILKLAQVQSDWCAEALKQWPDAPEANRFLYMKLVAEEYFPRNGESGKQLWRYANLVTAKEKGTEVGEITYREIRRVIDIRKFDHAAAYGEEYLKHVSQGKTADEIRIAVGYAQEHLPGGSAAAKANVEQATHSGDPLVRLKAKKSHFYMALRAANHRDTIQSATSLMQEDGLTAEERSRCLIERALSYENVKEPGMALLDCKELLAKHPTAPNAGEAKRILDRLQTKGVDLILDKK